jgi:prefoldin subunit 5
MRAMRWSRSDNAPPDNVSVSNDEESLKQRLQALQSEMAAITKQLDELEEAAEEEETENDPL